MPIVFVLGTGRCGSTLVQEVLAKHPGAGYVTNVHDRFPMIGGDRALAALYRRIPPDASRKGRLRLAPTEGYRALDRLVSPAVSTPARDLDAADATPWLAQRTRSFFTAHAAAHQRPVFLHKFTGWPRFGFLSEVFPDALFVHIVRDGRAVANSWLQMPWWRGYSGMGNFGPLPEALAQEWAEGGRSFPLLAGLEWKMLMDAYRRAGEAAGQRRWLELRYEDVVADPRASFDQMLSFCGLLWTDAFERGFSQYVFKSGRTEAFRQDLGAADVSMLTQALGGHLGAHGYSLDGHSPDGHSLAGGSAGAG